MRQFQVWRKTSALALASVLVLATGSWGTTPMIPATTLRTGRGRAPSTAHFRPRRSPRSPISPTPASSPTGGGFGGTRGSLAWQGCTYETDGDAQVMIAIVVGAQGEPDVASYDEFAEGAGRSSEPVLVDGIGDSAVQYRDRLYFKAGDTAYAVSGEDDQDEPLAPEVLEEIAAAVVDAG